MQNVSLKGEELIIIMTTSPIQSNPSTEIIDMAIDSIKMQVSLANILIYIVCDGVKISKENLSKYKSGIVSNEANQNYQLFKKNLHVKYEEDEQIVIEERAERYCFAENIRHVMAKISQPYVLIFQHDHMFTKVIDFVPIFSKIIKYSDSINYIGLMNQSVFKIPHSLDQNLQLRAYFSSKIGYTSKHDHSEYTNALLQYYEKSYEMPLMPLLFWYDKVHIAKKSYYLDVIFNKYGFYDEYKKKWSKTVSFVEDSFGVFMKNAIKRNPCTFQQLKAFILWEENSAWIVHNHGRGFITEETRQELYFKNIEEKSSSEGEQEEVQINLDSLY